MKVLRVAAIIAVVTMRLCLVTNFWPGGTDLGSLHMRENASVMLAT
jgi:hypothetical protein